MKAKKGNLKQRLAGDRYFSRVPKVVPAGRIVVHNHIRHTADTPPGANGFRAWTTPEPNLTRDYAVVPCGCDWATHLGTHYRVKRGKQ
jgi:hypothetical protein